MLLCYRSTFVSICLGCLLLLFGACSSTEHNASLFGLWLQDANRPLKQVGAITAAAGGVCSTGCESLLVLVSLFVVVLFFQQSLLMVSFGVYPLNSSRACEQVFQLQDFCFQEVSESSTGGIESLLW